MEQKVDPTTDRQNWSSTSEHDVNIKFEKNEIQNLVFLKQCFKRDFNNDLSGF